MIRPTWQERLLSKSTPNDAGCWIWTGHVDGDGYARMQKDGTPGSASRLAYEFANGPVSVGLEIDHLCNVRRCVNPRHLEVVTHAENLRRRSERQTHCVHGHERTPENTYIPADGWKRCRECARIRQTARRAVA